MLAMNIYIGGHMIEFHPVSPENIAISHERKSINLEERKVKTFHQNEKTLFS